MKRFLIYSIKAWSDYLIQAKDWKKLIHGVQPKKSGCGLIYELGNPIHRPNEDLAIADMSGIPFTHPHYHRETEVYFILQGRGVVVVGDKEESVQKGSIVLVSSNTAHYTIPKADLIIAVVATPAYNPKNTVPLYEDRKMVQFNFEKFKKLTLKN